MKSLIKIIRKKCLYNIKETKQEAQSIKTCTVTMSSKTINQNRSYSRKVSNLVKEKKSILNDVEVHLE